MRSKLLKTAAVASLLFSTGLSFAQQQVNLTAGPAGTTTPDGNGVPMWGYTCGAAVTGSTATCTPLSGPSSPAATGALGSVAVVNGGAGYTGVPSVTISAPTGTFTNPFTNTAVAGVPATATATVADGKVVSISISNPGAGYTAAPSVTIAAPGGTGTTATATAGPAWSPVVITVPTGATGGLQINLTNNLSFTPSGTTTPNTIPTSIMIVGQIGGGLGAGGKYVPSPDHSQAQTNVTWPIANVTPANPGQAPAQGSRVQSFGTEVTGGTGTSTALTWPPSTATTANLRPGTYLLESGTHPSIQVPMGLIGMLVVTTAPTTAAPGTAYPAVATATGPAIPAVQYNAEVPLEFSEIDPVQNNNVNIAVNTAGFSETATYGSYAAVGPISYVHVSTGGSGYATTAPNVSFSGGGGSGAMATAQVDTTPGSPTYGQVIGVTVTNGGTGYSSPPLVSLTGGSGTGAMATSALFTGANSLAHCGEGLSTPVAACYPPAVNYTPFYFLINGVAFNKTNAASSVFSATQGTATATTITGTVLVRLVNAGLKMHVPSIVGSQTTGWVGGDYSTTAPIGTVGGFTLIAEDGNPVPGPLATPTCTSGTTCPAPRVQTDVFMAAGKTFDVMINAPTSGPPLPIYDRELSLSANSSVRDAGMLAYIGVNGTTLPGFAASVAGTAVARPDTYNSVVNCTASPCTSVVVSNVSKGLIANDSFVNGVQLVVGPTGGTLTCNASPGNPVPGLCSNGTFTYTPNVGTTSDSFWYCANGAVPPTSFPPIGSTGSSTGSCASVTLGAAPTAAALLMISSSFTSKTAGYIEIPPPGPLAADKDPGGFPLSVVVPSTPAPGTCATVTIQPNGGFIATAAPGVTGCSFSYTATNGQGASGTTAVNITFPTPNAPTVTVVDGQAYKACAGDTGCINTLLTSKDTTQHITDYRWLIEEDKTFYVNPACSTNSSTPISGCITPAGTTVPPTFGVNFHTSHMAYVAQGCTGTASTDLSCEQGQTLQGTPVACDVGNGVCDTTRSQQTAVQPSQINLDPGCGVTGEPTCGSTAVPYPKRFYITVFPGDAANAFNTANAVGGHGMGGAPISWNTTTNTWNPVIVLSEPNPYPTGKLSVMVFEDDFPLNGEQDAGGGIDVIATNEPGLGGFEIILWDAYGQLGDVTGQMTHDMFNQPLSNSLAGTKDPANGNDACPIAQNALLGGNGTTDPTATGISGRIVTCPKYESDGKTLSPLAGQAVVANLMPGKFNVQAVPGADRIARGEEWLQTNTLDGQHQLDSFIRIGEPSYFQEYGPAGYHVIIGFANPAIINGRHAGVCSTNGDGNVTGTNCTNTVTGRVTGARMSRPPDERLYSSQSRDTFYWTQCFVSLGDPDGEDFMFTKCDDKGNFTFNNVPEGSWRLSIFDQWNDQLMDGLSTPVNVCPSPVPPATNPPTTCTANNLTVNMGDIAVQQWQANVYTRTFIDDNKDGISQPSEIGIPFLNLTVRYRDGSRANWLTTDFNGVANFNETFPLFNWYVVETDVTRYKTTGIHTVYDAGGPPDGSKVPACGGMYPACEGESDPNFPYNFLANTIDPYPLPADLSVPGAIYCTTATCAGQSINTGKAVPSGAGVSTGRIDPPWVVAEGWQGFSGQNNFIEFGKTPYADGENGGIQGHVVYASTRPFDDPTMNVQQPWEPLVPNVTINLYQEGFAADGVTPTLTLVDTTQTSSWDDWAQGFYPNFTDRTTGTPMPYMNCPGQAPAPTSTTPGDLFFYSLQNQPNYLDAYNSYYSGGTQPIHTLPYNSQYKCYDAMHNWNQLQPAPYDGMYAFPSVLGIIPSGPNAGKLNTALQGGVGTGTNFTVAPMGGTNCTICIKNPDTTDPWRVGTPMLPPGKYVVEVVPPPGYELVKEEDKNILIGDNFIAPVTQEFGGLGNIFIIPDQASVASMYDPSGSGLNPNNAQNPTQALGAAPNSQIVPGFIPEPVWPCVGQSRQVPDYMSIFPASAEVAPFAGATRHLCDRKEVTLTNQMASIAKFYIYTSTHIASKFAGVITDDFTSEFDPFAPVFGEKFAPPNMPVSMRDWAGNETQRVYSDQWGAYNGLTYSSWEVNPPNPTGYSPTMMVSCMNDKGPAIDFRPTITSINGTTGTQSTVTNPNYGKLVDTDPLFNPLYSQFCYELPYMPGATDYQDTPVVPTAAMVGAGYNNPDCAYPTLTPAIAEVDGDGVGPWVSAPRSGTNPTGGALTITALGDQSVGNYGYAGPQANGTCKSGPCPDNQTTVTRHYGFGTQCTALSTSCTAISSAVLIGPITGGPGSATVPLSITNWSDTVIQATVPSSITSNPHFPCPVQQQAQYRNRGGTSYGTAYCGQLVITAGNGRQSIDTVTVTVGGRPPVHVPASGSIQAAIDAAAPGDLIIVDPTCNSATGTSCTAAGITSKVASSHRELVLMWKPVRLQGVGAASSIIDASTHPAGALKLDPWRASVNCLFGLALNGQPNAGTFDSTGTYACPTASSPTGGGTGPDGNAWSYFYGGPNVPTMVVDRVPLEGILGWDATVNGNLAEQLQEPSIMGAYEGAAVTVLSKGVNIPKGAADPFGSGAEAAFPAGTTLLTGTNPTTVNAATGAYLQGTGDGNPICGHGSGTGVVPNQYPSNFMCNPSSIDGLGLTDASQGGGGIFVHGWGHNLQIANNRIYNNAGTLSGGISLGQGESPEAFLAPNSTVVTTTPPGSCADSAVTNVQLPYCMQLNVNVHNNMVVDNSSTGDELFSGTPAGAGGVSICTGSDYYKFNYNWVCGNLSTGDGGGVGHLGFSWNGDIEHNAFLFNQATNPSIQANGGGLIIMGAAPDATLTGGTECGSVTDNDCVPGLSDGIGPGLVVNANLFEGNSADAGSGGGLRFQAVNGTDIARFTNPGTCTNQFNGNGSFNCLWYLVSVTNNIINNNVAGWDGAGISLEDALAVKIINNTISSNDTTASSGVLFNTLGAPLSSSQSPTPTCQTQNGGAASCPQPAGLVSMQNSPQLTTSFTTGNITCPAGHYAPGTNPTNGTCINVSYPALYNNIFWQNRAFQVGVGNAGPGTQNQQNIVTLYNAAFGGTLTAACDPVTGVGCQTSTGACPTGSSYWDIGVRNDTGPTNHGSVTLNPLNGVLSPGTSGYSTTNSTAVPGFGAQYCNGSRVPPEATCMSAAGQIVSCGWQVPPGIADAVVPNPIFGLTPAATVDEGNNWINISWGPLSMLNPMTSNGTTNVVLGNYALASGSPDIDSILCSSTSGGVCTITPPTASNSGVTTYAAPALDFFGNARPDSNNANHIDVGAVEFQGGTAAAAPTLTAISPPSGVRGATVPLTLTGTLLTGASAVNVTGGGVTCTITGTPTATNVTANCVITRLAALGARSVTVVTPGGTTNPETFTVQGATIGFSGPTGMTTTPGNTTTKNGTITVSNTASGANAGPFTLTAAPAIAKTFGAGTGTATVTGGTCVSGFAINPGSSCTVTVRWVPTNTSTAFLTVTLAGTGTVLATPTTIFGAN